MYRGTQQGMDDGRMDGTSFGFGKERNGWTGGVGGLSKKLGASVRVIMARFALRCVYLGYIPPLVSVIISMD